MDTPVTKWTFYFDTGSVTSKVTDQDEDDRIQEALTLSGFLKLDSENTHLYVNLDQVKLATREPNWSEPPTCITYPAQ